ncbi:MAG: zinc-ribbon domain-containing protein [Candidatus Nanoarchaeia archaeon]|nr:zinc-ribbon domain-containing protein [Candidatus Nanoarchaeia archaeon]MDD5740362.1 zinc-ribbon domain-containing protein [Candidatus Nanoarchaeia archaeon]
MFGKKCPNCNRKIEKSNRFCPFCGYNLSIRDNEDFGFLGKDDIEDNFESMFNNFDNLPMNKILKTAMKMTEKMMKDMQNQELNQPKENYNHSMDIQFFVNGKRVFPETNIKQQVQKPIKIENKLAPEKINQISKLPRKEPKTKMKRLGEKLIYEIAVPGVDNIDDILINQLENSIEVKAISKTKVYSKNLNVNLPILKYSLDKGNLILELQAK